MLVNDDTIPPLLTQSVRSHLELLVNQGAHVHQAKVMRQARSEGERCYDARGNSCESEGSNDDGCETHAASEGWPACPSFALAAEIGVDFGCYYA